MVVRSVFTERYAVFRRALITARIEAGLSQKDVAERLGRPPSFVAKYELGERRLDVVEFIEIAEAVSFDPVSVIREVQQTPPG